MTARPHLIIGILIGAVFVYLAVRSVDISQMLGALADANYWYVLLAVLVNMFSHYLRAWRWQYFLAPIKTVNSGSLFSALIIGYAANSFVPAHLGEFLRAFAHSCWVKSKTFRQALHLHPSSSSASSMFFHSSC
jgi:uncharacterized protein (TIRG00374 family)